MTFLRRAVAPLLLVLTQAVLGLGPDLPVVRPVLALVTLLGLPTLVLYRRARLPADTGAARVLQAFGLSLLGLLLGGLLLNETLPRFGIEHPLAPGPLAAAWLVVDVVLLSWRRSVPLSSPSLTRATARRVLGARLEPAQTLAGLATVLAVLGAVRLNNGASGGVALVAVVLAAAALLVLLLARPTSPDNPDNPGNPGLGRDTRTLALVATSLLLATSLRGWTITGHDIQAEFLAFRLTDEAQRWQMSALPNAYNACLSVNILPTVLAQMTGLSGLVVFKVLLQLVFATVPVLTFLVARRFVPHVLAVAAASFTMAFPTFFTDMPYLVRQEVAFFFLGLMLLAATDPGRTRIRTRVLVALLGVGVILSHYSTTYVLLMALVAAVVTMLLVGLVRRLRRRPADTGRAEPLVLLHPLVLAALVATTLAWAGPITHTGGHAASVVRDTVHSITGGGDQEPSSSDTSYALFFLDRTSPRERMDLFVQETLDYRDATIPVDERVVTDPGPAELSPELLPPDTAPLTGLGRALDSAGISPVHLNNGAKLGCALLMQGFALLGVLGLWRRRGRRELDDATSTGLSRELAFLTVGALGALALIVLVPNLSVDYGVLRAFQQTVLVIAPVMALGMWTALRPLRSHAGPVAAAVPVVVLLVLTGVLPAALGGQQQRLALANAGIYYDRFIYSDSQSAALAWLGVADHEDTSNVRVIANRNVNVKLLADSDNRAPISDRLYPTLLTRDAYVFVDGQIMGRGVSTVFYTGDLLTYTYPLNDLDRGLDLVYSGPQARVYR